MSLPTQKPSFGVLDGLKVIYSAVEIAVPTACEIMSEWGADVTWIENTHTGDSVRDTTYVKEMERRNQRSLSMNPFSDEGKEILFKIIEDADVFVESSKGPAWARKGITDEMLWERNPKLVIVHVSGFGHTGDPVRVNSAAYDLTVQDYAGYVYQNGTPEQPMTAAPYTGDYFNSLMVVSSALAAVFRAQKTGKGESIDLAMYETMLRMGAYYMIDYLNAGIEYPRAGARNQNLCAIGQYKCRNGVIGLCVYGVPQNKYLLEVIGLGELWGTEDYPEDTSALWLSSPKAELIESKLEEYLLARDVEDVEADFTAHKLAAQKCLSFEDILAEKHVQERGNFIEWQNAEGQDVKGLNTVPVFKNRPGQFWRPMPPLGYDTADLLAKAGFSPADIERFKASGKVRFGDQDES
ncbi:L-carnitine CoA-transferase [Propionibacterium freudenreichii]|uniref:L-carnitine CoA-transferase n=1 Tax=Propionibacterium freudenreichii TaxID=1744 RepID=UPI0021A58EE0|nr:L-carnitine CoA-transferase [Propionibacterium freudenreichii]MCT2978209.1 L-carnitine CoA-transferase [Propionibacterium freudenreichii]MCT2985349.1 L-carnitine CoA-transferase [Propionibacterium freudenreichii]MCT2986693.1 L-carnitine CoA-transferase [Propionibacterium freudenreichii]MCT3015207.1 L-carnitine CoA-transferase [Propionibacterium freudenreichii]